MSHRQQPRPQCVVCTAASLLTPVWPETTSSECRSTGSALLSAGLSSAPAMPAGFAPKPSVKDGQRLVQHFWPSEDPSGEERSPMRSGPTGVSSDLLLAGCLPGPAATASHPAGTTAGLLDTLRHLLPTAHDWAPLWDS